MILRYISLTFKQDDVFEYEDDDLSASGSDFLSLSTKFSLPDTCCTGTVEHEADSGLKSCVVTRAFCESSAHEN